MRSHLFIYLLLLLTTFVFAQQTDSLKAKFQKPVVVSYRSEQDFFSALSSYIMMDTSFYGVHRYFPGNYPYSLFLTARNLKYQTPSLIGFRLGMEFYNLFGYSRSDVKYYNTRAPLTSVTLVFGQKKEQYSHILHTQNITKQWNVALNTLRIRSEGFYMHQNCTDNNISLATHYTTLNNRYSILANGIISSIKTDENGGVKDTIYEANLLVNKKFIPVYLNTAGSRRKNKEATVTQFINFGKRIEYKINDSSSIKKVIPIHYFSYSLHAEGTTYLYADKGPFVYYKNIHFDSATTHDSTHVLIFDHSLNWNSFLTKKTFAKISFNYQRSNLVQYTTDSVLIKNTDTVFKNNSLALYLGNIVATDSNQKFLWNIGMNYIIGGNNKQDRIIFGKASYCFNSNNILSMDVVSKNYSPAFIYTHYMSNHFKWHNNLVAISETGAGISFSSNKYKLKLGFNLNTISGYVYLDSVCKPQQYNSSIFLHSGFIAKHFTLRKFNLDNKITFQNFSNTAIFRLPRLVSFHSIYFQDRWFKKATLVQLGFDINYFSSYYANAYMPAIGLYYWQHKTQIGNYPFIDFFFMMKVKRAKIFFKTEHVNSGFLNPYYLAPNFPAPDRSIKLGINWDFYD